MLRHLFIALLQIGFIRIRNIFYLSDYMILIEPKKIKKYPKNLRDNNYFLSYPNLSDSKLQKISFINN